jgi:hypothetical protein
MTQMTFGLSPTELKALGLFIVTCSELENHINDVLTSLRGAANGGHAMAVTRESTDRKMKEIRSLAESREGSDELLVLANEVRWAIKTVQRARNMLAHGRLLYDSEARISFWSVWKSNEMSMADMQAARAKAIYAMKVTRHIQWKLMVNAVGGIFPITAPPPLPGRPA